MCETCEVAAAADGELLGPIHHMVAERMHPEAGALPYDEFRSLGLRVIHSGRGRTREECDRIIGLDRQMRDAHERLLSTIRRELGVEA